MIAHVFVRQSHAAAVRPVDPRELSASTVSTAELLWLDVQTPSSEDVSCLEELFHFHPLALEDVLSQHQRPKVDEYGDYYFVVLYAARYEGRVPRSRTSEFQFFWGRNYLVTVHAEPFPEIEDTARRLIADELTPVGGEHGRRLRVPDLVYRLVDGVIDGYFPVVDVIAEYSEDVEEEMFRDGTRPSVLQGIFALKKDILQLRKVIAPSRDVLNVLLRRDVPLYAEEFHPFFQDAYDHTVRVIDSLDTYRDLLSSTIDVYLSLASNSVNQAVKTMTAVTAILMVDALIAGIYGMNFRIIPELDWDLGYPWALGLMAGVSLLLWLLFRRIRWV